MDTKFWGKHLLIDCYGCDKKLISDKENIIKFLKQVVIDIDMVAYGEPIVEHFATHDPEKGGYTAMQLIETSLIDGHFVDATGAAYISVHSCKDFNEKDVLGAIVMYFYPVSYKTHTIYRK